MRRHNRRRPLPWYRDATTAGKAVLLTSAVLTGAIPILGGYLDAGVTPTLAVAAIQLVAANILVATGMQEESYDPDDPVEEFDDLDF